jgi:hypothetical protein
VKFDFSYKTNSIQSKSKNLKTFIRNYIFSVQKNQILNFYIFVILEFKCEITDIRTIGFKNLAVKWTKPIGIYDTITLSCKTDFEAFKKIYEKDTRDGQCTFSKSIAGYQIDISLFVNKLNSQFNSTEVKFDAR